MPTYEYACRDCGEHLEVVQSFKDDALTECPNCKGELRKVFSAAGIIFKGSGWHIKDYASKGGSSTTSSPGSADSGSSSDSSSDRSSSTDSSSDSSSKAAEKKDSGAGSSSSSTPSEKSA
ncbi:MAG: FmdB family transcriptional regulator [Actinobacteria bacterium]|nr:FmdB family transcriptional regulator [Actinomycetota bacterium]